MSAVFSRAYCAGFVRDRYMQMYVYRMYALTVFMVVTYQHDDMVMCTYVTDVKNRMMKQSKNFQDRYCIRKFHTFVHNFANNALMELIFRVCDRADLLRYLI